MTAGDRTRSHDNRFFGVAEAIVTANEDPDEEGRVKVNFPWFDGGQTESDWCRVSQLYAGNGYGACFVPEIGDEVLVAFVHGDMRFPVVLGGMYNGPDKPPTKRAGDEDKKMIRTKAGHQLVMDDGASSLAVELRTAGGHVLLLDEKGETVSLESKGGRKVVLDDGGAKVTVTTGQGTEIVLDGTSVTVKGQTVKVSGTSIELGDGASEPLVLGTQLLTLLATHTHVCTAPGAPSGPPVPPLTPAVLSTTVRTK